MPPFFEPNDIPNTHGRVMRAIESGVFATSSAAANHDYIFQSPPGKTKKNNRYRYLLKYKDTLDKLHAVMLLAISNSIFLYRMGIRATEVEPMTREVLASMSNVPYEQALELLNTNYVEEELSNIIVNATVKDVTIDGYNIGISLKSELPYSSTMGLSDDISKTSVEYFVSSRIKDDMIETFSRMRFMKFIDGVISSVDKKRKDIKNAFNDVAVRGINPYYIGTGKIVAGLDNQMLDKIFKDDINQTTRAYDEINKLTRDKRDEIEDAVVNVYRKYLLTTAFKKKNKVPITDPIGFNPGYPVTYTSAEQWPAMAESNLEEGTIQYWRPTIGRNPF